MTLSLLRVTTAFRAVSFVQAAFKVVPWMSCRMRDEPIRPSDVPVDYRKLMYWKRLLSQLWMSRNTQSRLSQHGDLCRLAMSRIEVMLCFSFAAISSRRQARPAVICCRLG